MEDGEKDESVVSPSSLRRPQHPCPETTPCTYPYQLFFSFFFTVDLRSR